MKSLKDIPASNNKSASNKQEYNAEINRTNPTAIIIMIDQSTSMSFEDIDYKGEILNYSEIVANMVNQMLNELIGRCTKSEGVRNYFDICVIGYGGKSAIEANILWEDGLEDKDWVSISELKENAKYKKKTVTKLIRGKEKTSEIDVPYWFEAVANYKTPMGDAFRKSYALLNDWIEEHQESYPPVVINITDGMQSDMEAPELKEEAEKIKALRTNDGNVLLLNCHISNSDQSIIFPLSYENDLGDEYSELLYEMSSVMPESYNVDISKMRNDGEVFSNYKGMAYNANMDMLFNLIDIGTSGATQQLNQTV